MKSSTFFPSPSQEYISDIVFRNILHENYPPWQIILVPLSASQYYIIVRLHHLYISEDRLGLSDLIMMNEDHGQWVMADDSIGKNFKKYYLYLNRTINFY